MSQMQITFTAERASGLLKSMYSFHFSISHNTEKEKHHLHLKKLYRIKKYSRCEVTAQRQLSEAEPFK